LKEVQYICYLGLIRPIIEKNNNEMTLIQIRDKSTQM